MTKRIEHLVSIYLEELIELIQEGHISGKILKKVKSDSIFTESNIKKALNILNTKLKPEIKISKYYRAEKDHLQAIYGFYFDINVPELYLPSGILNVLTDISHKVYLNIKNNSFLITLPSVEAARNKKALTNFAVKIINSFVSNTFELDLRYLNNKQISIKIKLNTQNINQIDKALTILKSNTAKWKSNYRNISRPTNEYTDILITKLNGLRELHQEDTFKP